jgi:Spy/CpxP family protein refolding chaperone
MVQKLFLMAVVSAMMVLPSAAEDEKKKKRQGNRGNNRVVAQFMKQLEPAKLTDEQIAKVKELGKEAMTAMTALRKEVELTPELQKKRAEVMKSMKDSELKGKERAAAINKEAGLSEKQAAALVKVNETRLAFQRKIYGMLSDEQKAALPEKMQKLMKAGDKKGNGKGKKQQKDS